jgi:2-dehydro-3-deoxyphosphogluconate aldolase/(4S)-4-hydroxy-2-oxoglutarate aldolase
MREDSMKKTIDLIEKEKIVVIVRGVAKEKLLDFAEAAYNGGVRLLECTYDASGNTSDEVIANNIKMLAEHFEGRMLIGAGTVLTERQVELTKNAGGKFVISPDTNLKIIAKTKKEGLVSIPGAFTPSEAVMAHNSGADFVKLFPISSLGSKYLKDIKAPLSHIRFLAVGGVNADNIQEFLRVGACGFGIGSNIVNKKWIDSNDFISIENAARNYVSKIKLFEKDA